MRAAVRQAIFEVIVRHALCGANWQELCANQMQEYSISSEEVMEEVLQRKQLDSPAKAEERKLRRRQNGLLNSPESVLKRETAIQEENAEFVETDNSDLDALQGEFLPYYSLEPVILTKSCTSRIYKAKHSFLCREVSIKLLRRELVSSPAARHRFENEAKIQSIVNHPGIISVFDFGSTQSGRPYMILERFSGKTLLQQVKENGPLSSREALRITKQICSALEHCHRRSIIHPRLNSNDIVILDDSSDSPCKIIDSFNAEIFDEDNFPKPLPLDADHRPELYAVGCIIYEALVGREYASDSFDLSNEEQASISPTLCRIILKALTNDPQSAYKSMGEIMNDLNQIC